jgi:arabinogalactan endo-1,4-beta-galactosidase
MGRHYAGDIEGKFMFAVQSSTAADRFGSTYCEPNYVEYYFDEDNLDTIKEELEKLKPNYDKVVKFFEEREGYTKEEMDMSDYADYVLGEKILNCILEHGECNFTAEL